MTSRLEAELAAALEEAEAKAWDSLGKYKLWMFGYHASAWVRLNRLGHFKRPNPFKALVMFARARQPAQASQVTPLFEDEAA